VSQLQAVLGLGAIAIVIDLVIRLVALVVVPRNRLPTAAMAWLLAIFFIPVIGVLLYLAIGSPKLPADRRRKQVEMNGVIEER
jgi:cardiolipin synthase